MITYYNYIPSLKDLKLDLGGDYKIFIWGNTKEGESTRFWAKVEFDKYFFNGVNSNFCLTKMVIQKGIQSPKGGEFKLEKENLEYLNLYEEERRKLTDLKKKKATLIQRIEEHFSH